MKIVLWHDAVLPVSKYGGTERVVWWIAKGLAELGVQVHLGLKKGSSCPFATVFFPDFSKPAEEQCPDADVIHYFNTPHWQPEKPYVVTIGGNGKPSETFLRNTIFVSQNHAARHGAQAFVHNGLDPEEYIFSEKKSDHLVFLAKASWAVKNVKGTMRIARRAGKPLDILGGSRWYLPHFRGVHWRGMVGGTEKAQILSQSLGLIFPVLWDEPFGIAVIEALVSGTPVLTSPFGSLPELVNADVGKICHTEDEFVEAIPQLTQYSAKRCREWVEAHFTYRQMAKKYVSYYEQVLAGKPINPENPKTVSGWGPYSLS